MTLSQQISFCSEKRFTGKLCITNLDGKNINDFDGNCWNIYFYRGRLVGDSAGIHPIRRLRRQFSQQPKNWLALIILPSKSYSKIIISIESKLKKLLLVA
jgi:hypothetical protein